MNVGEILTRVKRTFGDESGVQVTDADIIRWINDGQRQIVLQNEGLFEKTTVANSVANQSDYDLPTDLLILRDISYKNQNDSQYYRLKGFSLKEFHTHIDGFDGDSWRATPLVFTIFEKKIKLFPTPDVGITSGIKVYYNRLPVDVVNSVDVPELDVLYHESLVKYCLLQAYELDENFEAAGAKGQQVSAEINLLRGRMEWKDEGQYPAITVLPEDL